MSTQVSAAPKVQEVISPKHKIKAWLIESKAVPLVSMHFSFKGGTAYDSDEKAGLTNFVAALMDEGCGELGTEVFHMKMDELAARMGVSSDADRIQGSFQFITKNKAESVALLKNVFSAPRFDEEPMARIRQQTLVMIARKAENPGTLATEKLYASIFPNHPYGRPASGTKQTVSAFTKEDCMNFVKNRFVRKDLIIGVAGDIDAEELGRILDELFGALPKEADPKSLPKINLKLDGQLHVIQLADRPQTVSYFVQKGIDRKDPDFYAAFILNNILGASSFSARLMKEVRTKRGLTYGVGTQLVWNDCANYIIGSCATENSRFHESFDVIKSVYRDLAETGPSKEELDDAKSSAIGAFALMLDNTKAIAGFLAQMQKDGLGIDFLDKRNDHIRVVQEEQIKVLAKKLLNSEELTFFAAGNPKENIEKKSVPG